MINKNGFPERAQLDCSPGERVALCRCWQSKKFPYCDGSHREFNDLTGNQVGPIIVTSGKDSG